MDTGKVRFFFREYPLDPLAMGAVMLTRCIEGDKWYQMLNRLFETQETWSHSKTPVEALAQVADEVGMSREQFDACARNEWLYADVISIAKRAKEEFGVLSTPTFFINGEKHTGALTMEQFDQILGPMFAKAVR